MALDPVKIPQNVYIEDRIVGPLTLRQTLMMAAGGGISYALYAMLTKSVGQLSLFATILVWLPAAISVLFAIIKINDMSLLKICLLLLERSQKQPVRTFAPRRGISIIIRTSSAVQSAQESKKLEEERMKVEQAERRTQEKIRELSSIVDTEDGVAVVHSRKDSEETEESEETDDTPRTNSSESSDSSVSSDSRRFPVDKSRISVDRDISDSPSLADLTAEDFKSL